MIVESDSVCQQALSTAALMATLSPCPGGKVGAVIMMGGTMLSMGYNRAPDGVLQCDEAGCDLHGPGEAGSNRTHSRHVHAEVVAIALCARAGVSVEGATLFVTRAPCGDCAKLIMEAGIGGVIIAPGGMPDGWDKIVGAFMEDGGLTVLEWDVSYAEHEQAGRGSGTAGEEPTQSVITFPGKRRRQAGSGTGGD